MVKGTSMWPVVPAAGSFAMVGVPSLTLVEARLGSSWRADVAPDVEPVAPASTSFGARPAFITIERVKPAVAVSVSIWST